MGGGPGYLGAGTVCEIAERLRMIVIRVETCPIVPDFVRRSSRPALDPCRIRPPQLETYPRPLPDSSAAARDLPSTLAGFDLDQVSTSPHPLPDSSAAARDLPPTLPRFVRSRSRPPRRWARLRPRPGLDLPITLPRFVRPSSRPAHHPSLIRPPQRETSTTPFPDSSAPARDLNKPFPDSSAPARNLNHTLSRFVRPSSRPAHHPSSIRPPQLETCPPPFLDSSAPARDLNHTLP